MTSFLSACSSVAPLAIESPLMVVKMCFIVCFSLSVLLRAFSPSQHKAKTTGGFCAAAGRGVVAMLRGPGIGLGPSYTFEYVDSKIRTRQRSSIRTTTSGTRPRLT
jgi:hypothetical protein